MSDRRRDLLCVALLLVASLLFFGSTLNPGEGKLLYGPDLHWLFQISGRFAFSAFRAGQLPLWNPHLFLGFPQYAEPQLSTFYPPLWAAAWLRPAVAFSWLYALHVALLAIGGFWLVRQWGGARPGALLGGIALGFSTVVVARVHAGHLPHLMTLAYLPWVLLAAGWAVRRRSWAATVVAGVPLGLAMLAGYAPFYLLLVGAVTAFMGWAAARAWGQEGATAGLRIVFQWLGLGLVAGLLAAVQLLPTAEFALHSSRVAQADYTFASQLSLPFSALLRLLLPDVYGAPAGSVSYWAGDAVYEYWEFAVYAGILPLMLAGLAWVVGERRWRFWTAVGGMGLWLALGPAGGLHRVLYELVPGFGLFRVPARLAYFLTFAVAILAGLTFDRWFDLPAGRHKAYARYLRRALVVVPGLLLLLALLSVLWQAAQTEPAQSARVGNVTAQVVRLLLLVTATLALLIWGRRLRRWQVTALACGFLLVDLWGAGGKLVFLADADPDLGWIMADLALPPEREEYRVLSRGLPLNQGTLSGFYAVDGYDDFRTEASLALRDRAKRDARVARLLSAQYYLVADGKEPPVAQGWTVLTDPAGVTIYARDDVQPKAFVVHDVIGAQDAEEALRLLDRPELDLTQTAIVQVAPDTHCEVEAGDPAGARAEIVVYKPEHVVIRAEATATGWLVLNDLHYPGWQATVDGEPVPIQATDYGLRGVCLPAGEHEVVFRFRPVILKYGLAGSSAGLLLLLGALWYLQRSRVRM